MGRISQMMVRNALRERPQPKGDLVHVPNYPGYLFCPESDWLYSIKMTDCDLYPLQRITPTDYDDFEGWNVSNNGHKHRLSVSDLRKLDTNQGIEMNPTSINNYPTTNAVEYKGKFLIGSIHKETGAVSFTVFPARQPSLESAKKEAARLAASDKSKMFMAVEVKAIATVQEVVFL